MWKSELPRDREESYAKFSAIEIPPVLLVQVLGEEEHEEMIFINVGAFGLE